jgi:hypothetical protein
METPPGQRMMAKTLKGKAVEPAVQQHFCCQWSSGARAPEANGFPWRPACSETEFSKAGCFFARLWNCRLA